MVQDNTDPKMTAFTVTVDARDDISTGISAADRAVTLRALADSKVWFCPRPILVREIGQGKDDSLRG